jgi:hypothetical protein
MWGLWWTKPHWDMFSPSTSVSPANHSTNFTIIIITRGWHNRPIGGRSAEWTQLDFTPPLYQLKIINYYSNKNIGIINYLIVHCIHYTPHAFVTRQTFRPCGSYLIYGELVVQIASSCHCQKKTVFEILASDLIQEIHLQYGCEVIAYE